MGVGEQNQPRRLRLSRSKGWRLPGGSVKVARPTKWGNRYVVTPGAVPGSLSGGRYTCVRTAEEAVACFERLLIDSPELVEMAKRELKGRDLACWCDEDEPCHADVLLKYANN
jgi:hypothetical protein